MIGGLFTLLIGGAAFYVWVDSFRTRYRELNVALLKRLLFYHILMTVTYFVYAQFNPSDSRTYYRRVADNFRGDSWDAFYGTSTTFVEFVAYPFIKFGNFSYEAMMVLFSFFGFIGFVYFYIFFRENIRYKHTFLGFDLLTIIFFLPNLHFWSASLGKGSLIFLGLSLYFFGISRVSKRMVAVVFGGLIVYHVRPHIMFVVLISTLLGFIFSARQIGLFWRLTFIIGCGVALFLVYRDVLTLVGIDEEGFLTEGLNLAHRASELSKATSGIDISQYNLPTQVFTFLYRPLFFDAPGTLGYIVSFENVFYLTITLKLLGGFRGVYFLFSSNFLVKSAFLSFVTISIALAQIAGNLGLAMRQKSQVMILFLFVILSFMDSQKVHVSSMRKRGLAPPSRIPGTAA